MAETITISNPLTSSHASRKLRTATKSNARTQQPKSKHAPKASESNGITKKKQSKSRNGCVTCKAKRLKCDEAKPTCEQCKRRNVPCGGYKKDFKWRAFEEPSCTRKQSAKGRKGLASTTSAASFSDHAPDIHDLYHNYNDPNQGFHHEPPHLTVPIAYNQPRVASNPHAPFASTERAYPMTPLAITPQSISPIGSYASSLDRSYSLHRDEFVRTGQSEAPGPSSMAAGQSPQFVDLLIPEVDHCSSIVEYLSYRNRHEAFYQPTGLTPPAEPEEGYIEEISQTLNFKSRSCSLRHSSPTPSTSSNSSARSPNHRILAQPQHAITSPEVVSQRFHKNICGMLSVEDGPTENPWRTLVWPLARDCPALYHAIASMVSFHQSSQFPLMRIQGIDHMRTAVHTLAEGLEDMRFNAAISTTLVLAFAESWDVHISTGINHIKGAKVLINQALVQHRQVPKQDEELMCLKFLCNTWIYMDVIARLTSADDDESDYVDTIYESINSMGQMETSLDPLMGCAHSLFPIIGRIATLVRKVRRTDYNCPELVSQALHLKSQLERWAPPSYIENPENETTSAKDSIRTATAYQYATLLYLHQAVPEIPSSTAHILAKKVLCELAAVEPSSRSCIIHTYPLMVAGCEMTKEEDRAWVIHRWELLFSRMKLGIIDKALTITKEVWARRDAYAAECNILDTMPNDGISLTESSKRNLYAYLGDDDDDDVCWLGSRPKRRALDTTPPRPTSIPHLLRQECQRDVTSFSDNLYLFDPEYTAKGRLHWLSVMQDWNWQVLLG